MHPQKGYGPSLSDQGIDPDDAPLVSAVTNCHGCQIEYDRETGAATIRYCADHDLEERAVEASPRTLADTDWYVYRYVYQYGAHDACPYCPRDDTHVHTLDLRTADLAEFGTRAGRKEGAGP